MEQFNILKEVYSNVLNNNYIIEGSLFNILNRNDVLNRNYIIACYNSQMEEASLSQALPKPFENMKVTVNHTPELHHYML